MEEHQKAPPKRIAQHKLAREVLRIVHGQKLAYEAELEHARIFNRSSALNPKSDGDEHQSMDHVDMTVPFNNGDNRDNRPPTSSLVLPKSLVYNQRISHVLYHAGLVPSRSEGFRLVSKKGASVGARPSSTGPLGNQVDWSPAANWDGKETEKYILGDDTLLLRVGKWKIKVIKIISDEEFEEKGLSAPGWKEDKPENPLSNDIKRMKVWHERKYIQKTRMHREAPRDWVVKSKAGRIRKL